MPSGTRSLELAISGQQRGHDDNNMETAITTTGSRGNDENNANTAILTTQTQR